MLTTYPRPRALASMFALAALLAMGAVHAATSEEGKAFLETNAQRDGVFVTETGLQYSIIKRGDTGGDHPTLYNPVTLHYSGKLIDGSVFDEGERDGIKGNRTIRVVDMVAGMKEAVQLMTVGDVYEITLPSELGYGDYSKGDIPASSVLIFVVELVAIQPEATTLHWLSDMVFRRYPMLLMVSSWIILKAIGWIFGLQLPKGPMFSADIQKNPHNPRVFLDISIDGKVEGRIIIELFKKLVPKTVENFFTLATGTAKDKKWTYKGCKFHRIIENFMCQSGDFTKGDGKGGRSIFDEVKFDDEFEQGYVTHEKFVVSMANAGKNSNGSQFFITTSACPHLDGKHVVFGTVVEGFEIITAMEKCAGVPPTKSVIIQDCGEVKTKTS